MNSRGGPSNNGDFGDRDRHLRDPYIDRRVHDNYESRDRYPPRGGGGGGGGGYSRGPPDIRGGYNDRGDYRGYDGPHGHGYDPRGPPGPPIHFSDNRRFRFVISLYVAVKIFCISIFYS